MAIKEIDRLTHKRVNGIKTGYWSAASKEAVVQRLAEYENTGLTPEQIKHLSSAARWIPCSEKLPKVGETVLVCREKEKGVPYIEQATLGVNGWWKVYGTNVKRVDFWRPFPLPPEKSRTHTLGADAPGVFVLLKIFYIFSHLGVKAPKRAYMLGEGGGT